MFMTFKVFAFYSLWILCSMTFTVHDTLFPRCLNTTLLQLSSSWRLQVLSVSKIVKSARTHLLSILYCRVDLKCTSFTLTDGIFETGVYAVPSKSQNSTVLGQGGPSSTQFWCSNPSWAWRWHHPFGTNNYQQLFSYALDFFIFKIRLEKYNNIWCGVRGNLSKQEWWCQNG